MAVMTLRRGREKVCFGNRRLWLKYKGQILNDRESTGESCGHTVDDPGCDSGDFVLMSW